MLKEVLKATRKQFEDEPSEVPDMQTSDGLTFDQEIAKIEAEISTLKESQSGLKPRHSEYQRSEHRIQELTNRKLQLNERATSPTSQLTLKPNPQREKLQSSIQDKEIAIKEAEGKSAQLEADVKDLRTKQAARVEVFRQIQALDREAASRAMPTRSARPTSRARSASSTC
jgi:predicted  nucleic acid-binding Zn-ribbon protein